MHSMPGSFPHDSLPVSTFKLLELPSDIRLLIYSQYYKPWHVKISSLEFLYPEDGEKTSGDLSLGNIPTINLLLASRLIYAECKPVYDDAFDGVVQAHGFDYRDYHLPEVRWFLERATTLKLFMPYLSIMTVVPLGLMPKLQLLILGPSHYNPYAEHLRPQITTERAVEAGELDNWFQQHAKRCLEEEVAPSTAAPHRSSLTMHMWVWFPVQLPYGRGVVSYDCSTAREI